VLREMIAGDEFSSLWATDPAKGGLPEGCVRAIPAGNLRTSDAYRRLLDEVAFWQDLSGSCAVDLYDCGLARRHYFLVMRYMQEGSVADWLERGSALTDRLESFALDFASALRELHSSASAHGNLKPSNVFPLADGGVLLSDFAIPLWADELEQGCEALESHVIHPYQDAQQREDVRDYDTRSDVYAFGLILMRCVTGADPDAEAPSGRIEASQWPGWLGAVVQKCLAPARSGRPADGFELFDMLSGGIVFVAGKGASPGEAPREPEPADVPALLEQGRALTEDGSLGPAMDILESLPAGTEGVDELIDEIDKRHKACEALVQEAVSLAGMGKPSAAMDAIADAEKLWADSATVAAVKADLAAAAGQDEALLEGKLPPPLLDALEARRYPLARTHLEKLIRGGHLSDEALAAIESFKKGRVRTAFLDSIASARRLYVLGHHHEAAKRWLEAARWLPGGQHRNRLRRIAAAAGKGSLGIDVQQLGLVDLSDEAVRSASAGASAAETHGGLPEPQPAKGTARPRRRLPPLAIALAGVLLGCLALLLLWALAGG